jgi:hypothetical protein
MCECICLAVDDRNHTGKYVKVKVYPQVANPLVLWRHPMQGPPMTPLLTLTGAVESLRAARRGKVRAPDVQVTQGVGLPRDPIHQMGGYKEGNGDRMNTMHRMKSKRCRTQRNPIL